jgi:hypothetical protein
MMGISYMNLTWFFANRCFAYLLRCNSALHNARLLTFNQQKYTFNSTYLEILCRYLHT